MDETRKLYDVLVRDGYYTKSFEDFQVQLNDPTYVDKVYGVVTRDGLFTQDKEVFIEKYKVKKKSRRRSHYGIRIGNWFFGIARVRVRST